LDRARCAVKLAAYAQGDSALLLNGLVVERRKGDCELTGPTFWTGLMLLETVVNVAHM